MVQHVVIGDSLVRKVLRSLRPHASNFFLTPLQFLCEVILVLFLFVPFLFALCKCRFELCVLYRKAFEAQESTEFQKEFIRHMILIYRRELATSPL